MCMKQYILPKVLGSERLDTVIAALESMKGSENLILNWKRVTDIEPSGVAIVSILIDQAYEKNCKLTHLDIPSSIKNKFPSLTKNLVLKNSIPITSEHYFRDKKSFHVCCEGGLNLEYKEILISSFKNLLDEDMLFSIQLVFNELIQNAVDHSSSERYYVYFGLWDDEIHFGVLDMGVTLPSKMEQKYNATSDIEFLEMSLKEGITTRRLRSGGLGLFHTFEMIKSLEGKFVFISRNGQIRRYFSQRKSRYLKLKNTLHGTWVMFTFKSKGHLI